jgi:hypothetical protein
MPVTSLARGIEDDGVWFDVLHRQPGQGFIYSLPDKLGIIAIYRLSLARGMYMHLVLLPGSP